MMEICLRLLAIHLLTYERFDGADAKVPTDAARTEMELRNASSDGKILSTTLRLANS
jgi:hypothetical protein